MIRSFLLAAALALIVACQPQGSGSATLLVNVAGYTLSGDSLRRFEALLIDSGRVVATGDAATLREEHPAARVIDGQGRTLLPGLIDAHGHVMGLGQSRRALDLGGVGSLRELQLRLRAYAQANPRPDSTQPGWIIGRGWNQELWPTRRFPTAADLDSIVPDRPVYLERVDGHAAVVNSKALALAGVTARTLAPVGGAIERNLLGLPTGLLIDNAMGLVERSIPPPSMAEDSLALETALAELRSLGLTGVHDAGVSLGNYRLYERVAQAGRLTTRIYAMAGLRDPSYDSILTRGPIPPSYGDRLALQAVKVYADGALGSRGAALLEPYADQPTTRGLLFMSSPQLNDVVSRAAERGFQVCVHAIGDAANRQALDAFEALLKANPKQATKLHRIEHAQVVHPADFARFARLGVVASMQPTHATSDKNMAETRLGPERIKGAYAWRTLLEQRALLAAGSDFPVEGANPFWGWYAAVTRQDTLGQPAGGWKPEQALTLVEAFRAFTLDAARAARLDHAIGSLEPGKWADFILVDADPFTGPPDRLWRIRVLETWVAGERVYAAPRP